MHTDLLTATVRRFGIFIVNAPPRSMFFNTSHPVIEPKDLSFGRVCLLSLIMFDWFGTLRNYTGD